MHKVRKIIAFQQGTSLILKNYGAGKRDRFDVFELNADKSGAVRIGCELTLGHAKQIAMLANG